ncbi:lamin tail domain-containing protein [Jatrophihabitans endophyticus]|uniref:lamin tail domain-containing protein n=1 Tax=Jatrophihabitans endophyticus TaxID=1206085 RepID=UPI0026E94DDD|nr:lamin tail domain-containing protein [Jatrophihabitans endophyticus]
MHSARPARRGRLAAAAGATAATALVLGLAVAAGTPATAASPAGLTVSEVYGGGGNSGSTLTHDFIELQNSGTAAVDLSGYSVQYTSSKGTGSWSATPLTGSIPAGGHYLVQEAAGTAGTTALPTPDDTGSINLSGSAGTVALVDSPTTLTCASSATCTGSPVVDLVGYGAAAIDEGSSPAPAPTDATQSDSRDAAGTDTDQNGADFTAVTADPQNSGLGGGGTPTPGPLQIHDIQGDSFVSPQDGNAVTNVPGVVTALRTSSSDGFWMQDTTPDDDPATSEGIFVYTGSKPTVAPGDSVLVSGTVSDYYALAGGESLSTTSSLSVTEITKPTVTTLSTGNPLPAPVVLGPSTVPDRYAPDLGGGNIEKTPIQPNRSALDYYESIEGMRAEVDDARVVGPTDSYNETYVTTKPNQDRTYRGGAELLGENKTPSGRLEIVPLTGSDLGLNVGDVLTGATIGPIDWSLYGGYTLEASTVGTPQSNNLPPVVAKHGRAKQLSIATYNVENLSPQDPASKFAALGRGVVTNLSSPDIVALEEIQDNSGATDDGTVAAGTTIRTLIKAISAAGGPAYSYRQINPVNDKDGGEPGGNIRNVFLFNPKRVGFVHTGSAAVDRSTKGTTVVAKHGQPTLSLSPGRLDPTNAVWASSRKPLVAQFRFRGKVVTVIGDHFDAKLGDQNADGRFQYPAQSSATQRAGQASVEHAFVQKILRVNRSAPVVVLGDLNDYQFSPALKILRTGTAGGSGTSILDDLITGLPKNQQYTYVYDGVSQVLDHILVTSAIHDVDYQVVHVNAEYSDQVSDHDPQVVDLVP